MNFSCNRVNSFKKWKYQAYAHDSAKFNSDTPLYDFNLCKF